MNHLPNFVVQPRESSAFRFAPSKPRVETEPVNRTGESAEASWPKNVSPELMQFVSVGSATLKLSAIGAWRRNGGVRLSRAESVDQSWDEEEVRRQALRGASGVFAVAGRGQSSGQSSSENEDSRGQTTAGRHQAASSELNLPNSNDASSLPNSSYLCTAVLTLSQRCAEHHLTQGDSAMAVFLRNELLALLPIFVRELGSKLRLLESSSESKGAFISCRPVAEVCEELVTNLRPLYARYVAGPYLLADTRFVLCAAQSMLEDEVGRWSDSGALKRVMHDTINPMFAILIMSCMKPPARGPVLSGTLWVGSERAL